MTNAAREQASRDRAASAQLSADARPLTGSVGCRLVRRSAVGLPLLVAAALGSVMTAPSAVADTAYRVQSGDTVSEIAQRAGVSQAAIIEANDLGSHALIQPGQVLTLPSDAEAASSEDAAAAGDAAPQAEAAMLTYRVQPGDTVSQIAARTGLSSAAIIEANGLGAGAVIRVGQVLSLPGRDAAPAPSGGGAPAAESGAASRSYTVVAGDTLSTIAARIGSSVSALRALNPGLGASAMIHVGQTLTVPGESGQSAESTQSVESAQSAPMPSTFAGRTYPSAVVQAATVNRDVLAARSVPTREQMQAIVVDAALRHGVDPALAQAVAFQESGFNHRAVSPANAVGAMQVIPAAGTWASGMAGRDLDLLDPYDNATAGVLVLRANLSATGDVPTALAAYYQGLGSVRANGMYADTQRYVANVQAHVNRFA